MGYAPMARSVHLTRGYCCEAYPQCQLCPYEGARQAPPIAVHRASRMPINAALPELMCRAMDGETLHYFSEFYSLEPVVILCGGNLTIHYRSATA